MFRSKINELKIDDRLFWLLLAITPLILCVIVCALQGHLIIDYYLPSSRWNDEIVYYKQVEGIVNFGMPLGYFGYNESHAEIGTCATWSPALCIVWVIFGKIFSWKFLSPIFCNIIWISICLYLFAVIVNADKKQCIYLMVLYSSFFTYTRLCLSGLSDISCYGWIIIFVALAYRLVFMKESKIVLLASILVNYLLVLMRPYFLVFALIPLTAAWRKTKNKIAVILGGIVVSVVYVYSYYFVYNKLCAPYFTNLINYDWLEILLSEGLVSGFNAIITLIANNCFKMAVLMKEAILYGNSAGINLIVSLIILLFLLKNASKNKFWLLYWGSYYFVILFASFLFFDIFAGAKHMITFALVGALVLVLEKQLKGKDVFIIATIILIIFVPLKNYSVNMELPFDREIQVPLNEFEKSVSKNIVINKSNNKWDNTVDWVLEDEVDGKFIRTKWQMCYGLPKGVGLNIVERGWVINEFNSLKSKYLFTVQGGGYCQNVYGRKKIGII